MEIKKTKWQQNAISIGTNIYIYICSFFLSLFHQDGWTAPSERTSALALFLSVYLSVCLLGGAMWPLCQEDAELVLEPAAIKHPARQQQQQAPQLEPQPPAGDTVAI